ncbi:PEPxxWA-CTERM sorting domain-containing protein [Sphingomonas sp. 1P06PA]|uniref:PEPxxWA-CTERM sorting domain-containing protein n=1 Tax=Sphingomonas sp. 1P06PA TaxID=554121 RepID=UPI0039A4A91C
MAKFFKLAAAAAFAMGASVAAQAATFDAFTSFDGTQGAGGFYYGTTDGTIAGSSLFTSNTNCVIANSICLQVALPSSQGDFLPGVYKSTIGANEFGTVNVPGDALVFHPGPEAFNSGTNLESVFVAYLVQTSGLYSLSASATLIDDTPTGVGITGFLLPSGQTSSVSLTGPFGTSYSASGQLSLTAGDVVGFYIDKQFSYYNDSTAVNFSLTAVPEPATWALMIGGFGAVGGTMRRRRTAGMAIA